MRRWNRGLAIISAVALMVTGFGTGNVSQSNAAKALKLTKTKVTLKVGAKSTIKVKNATKKTKVTWKSSKASVAKITKKVAKGKKASVTIKGAKAGNATISASYKLGKKTKKLKCKVTVKAVEKKDNGQDATATPAADTKTTEEPKMETAGPTIPAGTAVPTVTPTGAPTETTAPESSDKPVVEPTEAPTEAPTAAPTEEPIDPSLPQINLEPVSDFKVIENSKAAATMYIDEKDSEFDGIQLIADTFKADVARVAGIGVDEDGVANESADGLQIVTDSSKLSGNVIIAGTIGENGNSVIKKLVEDGKLDVSKLEGRWESYQLQVVKNPMAGVDQALVIAGSDKRGTIYGMFHISELMGVSPWVWWSDIIPKVQSNVTLKAQDISMVSMEPSVKYRGIFLNDEAPSLTSWSKARFDGRNQYFYKHVYELILRLHGDYLWPAMWSDVFSEGGKEKDDKLANAKLADAYGIVMGTSHHEPLYRAGAEWGNGFKANYQADLDYSAANTWNLYNIPGLEGYDPAVNAAIEDFWDKGVQRNKDFDNICTVGMRGENDSTLPAADEPEKYSELLNYIINTQKGILEKNKDTNPTQLVIYKEVEDAWYAGNLFEKDCMKNTIAMFADDNWAYLRTLPTYEQQKNIAGLGMYYHFDYVGAPKSYTWVQTTQISRIWDQMTVAYDYGIDDVWIVNVGDLKPMEMDISYFMDLAYDYSKWGIDGQDKIAEYKDKWIRQQFARQDGSGLNDKQLAEASQLISDYLDLETSRKVEHVLYNTAKNCSDMFSIENYNEAQDVLMKCNDIMERAEALKAQVPDDLQAAFYQLVYYPAMAVPNVLKIQIYAALNNKYATLKLTAANTYKKLCEEAIALDADLYDTYNNDMPGGIEEGKKWKGMQSAGQKYHIGMTSWETDSGKLPTLKTVEATEESALSVLVENVTSSFAKKISTGEASLPAFTSTNKEVYTIELATTGGEYNYTAKASDDWIVLSSTSGTVKDLSSIQVNIDWAKVSKDATGSIELSDGTNTVTVKVAANVIDESGLSEGTYIMANGYATINVANFVESKAGVGQRNNGKEMDNKMVVVEDNGKYMNALRTSSSTTTYEDLAQAPYVEYKVYVPEEGTYQIQSQFNPTSNLVYENTKLRYGLSIDGADAIITNSIVPDYLAGTWKQGTWAGDIEKNGRSSVVNNVKLTKGAHTIRYYQCDPNMALIRMTVSNNKLAACYNSPAESYYVGKKVDTAARLDAKTKMYSGFGK